MSVEVVAVELHEHEVGHSGLVEVLICSVRNRTAHALSRAGVVRTNKNSAVIRVRFDESRYIH